MLKSIRFFVYTFVKKAMFYLDIKELSKDE